MMKLFQKRPLIIVLIVIILALSIFSIVSYRTLPAVRFGAEAELVMLGDLNNDEVWDAKDLNILNDFLLNPFLADDSIAFKIDVNCNDNIDEEDLVFLKALYKYSDPYKSEKIFSEQGKIFPKPREFYRYIPKTEYIQRPLFLLNHKVIKNSVFENILHEIISSEPEYKTKILNEIYNEAIHYSFLYEIRKPYLYFEETEFAQKELEKCQKMYLDKEYFNLLLGLMNLVEHAEALSIHEKGCSEYKYLVLRDHFRKLLSSDLFLEKDNSKVDIKQIIDSVEVLIKKDLGMELDISKLKAPRDFSRLNNYLDRIEWQYYKSTTKNNDFNKLLKYTQYNRRYLRAVSNTNSRHSDPLLLNHNLPMILLFRKALEIKKGNKKAAVGMLDEVIRVPYAWVKAIPREMLPASSIAFENFLLPGNKEDGCDKSRHWNVFGGVSLYKSPEESFRLSLMREVNDLKDADYSHEAFTEFIRDEIANLNGIYYVTSIDNQLIDDVLIDSKNKSINRNESL